MEDNDDWVENQMLQTFYIIVAVKNVSH